MQTARLLGSFAACLSATFFFCAVLLPGWIVLLFLLAWSCLPCLVVFGCCAVAQEYLFGSCFLRRDCCCTGLLCVRFLVALPRLLCYFWLWCCFCAGDLPSSCCWGFAGCVTALLVGCWLAVRSSRSFSDFSGSMTLLLQECRLDGLIVSCLWRAGSFDLLLGWCLSMPVFVAVPEFFRFLREGLLALRARVMPTSIVAAGFWLV